MEMWPWWMVVVMLVMPMMPIVSSEVYLTRSAGQIWSGACGETGCTATNACTFYGSQLRLNANEVPCIIHVMEEDYGGAALLVDMGVAVNATLFLEGRVSNLRIGFELNQMPLLVAGSAMLENVTMSFNATSDALVATVLGVQLYNSSMAFHAPSPPLVTLRDVVVNLYDTSPVPFRFTSATPDEARFEMDSCLVLGPSNAPALLSSPSTLHLLLNHTFFSSSSLVERTVAQRTRVTLQRFTTLSFSSLLFQGPASDDNIFLKLSQAHIFFQPPQAKRFPNQPSKQYQSIQPYKHFHPSKQSELVGQSEQIHLKSESSQSHFESSQSNSKSSHSQSHFESSQSNSKSSQSNFKPIQYHLKSESSQSNSKPIQYHLKSESSQSHFESSQSNSKSCQSNFKPIQYAHHFSNHLRTHHQPHQDDFNSKRVKRASSSSSSSFSSSSLFDSTGHIWKRAIAAFEAVDSEISFLSLHVHASPSSTFATSFSSINSIFFNTNLTVEVTRSTYEAVLLKDSVFNITSSLGSLALIGDATSTLAWQVNNVTIEVAPGEMARRPVVISSKIEFQGHHLTTTGLWFNNNAQLNISHLKVLEMLGSNVEGAVFQVEATNWSSSWTFHSIVLSSISLNLSSLDTLVYRVTRPLMGIQGDLAVIPFQLPFHRILVDWDFATFPVIELGTWYPLASQVIPPAGGSMQVTPLTPWTFEVLTRFETKYENVNGGVQNGVFSISERIEKRVFEKSGREKIGMEKIGRSGSQKVFEKRAEYSTFEEDRSGKFMRDLREAANGANVTLFFRASPPLIVTPSALPCPPPPPRFICHEGVLVAVDSIEGQPSLSLPPNGGVVVVFGNVSVSQSIVFEGLGSTLNVTGCIQTPSFEIDWTHTPPPSKSSSPTTSALLAHQSDRCNTSLLDTELTVRQDSKACQKISVHKDPTLSSSSSLFVLFKVDDSACSKRVWPWIILGSVLGVLLLSLLLTLLIYRLRARRFAKAK